MDGGFENGWAPWSRRLIFVVYNNGQVAGESARDAKHYAATNTSVSGGGFYEDLNGLNITAGQSFCASAWVRTQAPANGAAGTFVIWLLGGAYNENGTASFSGLGHGNSWKQVQPCVSASTSHSTIRIQFYPRPNAPTLDVDDVDVH